MKEHKTRQGALLACLEHRCVQPGFWFVEGWTVTRIRSGKWRAARRERDEVLASFTAALEMIADDQVD